MSEHLHCPRCSASNGLWAPARFAGWCSVVVAPGEHRPVLTQSDDGSPNYEADREAQEIEQHEIGCSCGWEGDPRDLLDCNGEPQRTVHPQQMALVVTNNPDEPAADPVAKPSTPPEAPDLMAALQASLGIPVAEGDN